MANRHAESTPSHDSFAVPPNDAADVKRAASGQWTVILPALTGIDATVLDERNHPCPQCGGTDRFRCLDADTGALFCNQCFYEKNGDGFAAVQWLTGWTFQATLQAVAEFLNMHGSRNGHATNGQARGATAKPTSKGRVYATSDEAVSSLVRSLGPVSKSWTYHAADGEPVGIILRWNLPDGKKNIRPIARTADGWCAGGMPAPRPLYQLPTLIDADTVFVTEGEKAADAVRSIGLVATTSAHGAASASKTDWTPLAGHDVVILPDHDEAGRKYAAQVAAILLSLNPPAMVRVVDLPGLPDGGDMVEWLAARPDPSDHDEACDALLKLVEAAELIEADTPVVSVVAPCSADESDEVTVLIDEPWPSPPSEAAFHGVAGDIVRLIEPHTEADPVAMLIQLLVVVGNLSGRHRYFCVESTRHYSNLFAVLVGSSSTGRKGTSGDHILRLVQQVDPEWAADRRISGLVSGEGVIWNVRDPSEGGPRSKDDEGVADKRLMAYESEFSSVLKCKARDSNTLGEVLRQAWDSGNLRTAAKNCPARATHAHISLIGHITPEELRECLLVVDKANGYANRLLWCGVRRSKLLPDGGQIQSVDFSREIFILNEVVEFAARKGEIVRDRDAASEWRKLYPSLTRERFGVDGPLCNRAAAQVVRLSLLYAILDRSDTIRVEHLKAAHALWEYCERSVKHIFGDGLADRTSNAILVALKSAGPAGLSRTGISLLLSGNKSKAEIDASLQKLYTSKLARREKVATNGRSVEVWHATE